MDREKALEIANKEQRAYIDYLKRENEDLEKKLDATEKNTLYILIIAMIMLVSILCAGVAWIG